ncbi:MAG: radical SAM family heme chaperone HemW [Blautia sp.]|nr:radical SAM family heme chaperone HemW [Blautia sp.]
MTASSKRKDDLEIYVHIPFCIRKCEYCDFLSGPAGPDEQEKYVQALLREIQWTEEGKGRSVSSIFIGGGTPSVLDEKWIGRILEEIKSHFQVDPQAEISIEVNPGTADYGKFLSYRQYGINRVSIGLQSPDDRELKILGRIHTFSRFLESYEAARKADFTNINVDLISAIPDQTYEKWVNNLKITAELEPEHISAYSLIIEEGTPFAGKKLNLPDEDTEYEMYEATARILKQYGYEQYEISNYAKKEKACRHNIGYWTRKDYLGLGLGASSLYGTFRFKNTENMEEYMKYSAVSDKIRIVEPELTLQDEMAEFMFLGLRMTRGISKTDFQREYGLPVEKVYGKVLEKYMNLKLMEEKDDRIFLTRPGIHVSNAVMADFIL